MKKRSEYILKLRVSDNKKASLTVEASLIMPLFLFFMIAFLYFVQIFMIQEQIQAAITKMGLNLSKLSYVYDDFLDTEDAQIFDQTIFGTEFDIGLQDFAGAAVNGSLLKLYTMRYLDMDQVNKSCIKNGFDGISFFHSAVMDEQDCIDIIVHYRVKIPITLFVINEMSMTQRVRLRGWTGYQIPAAYLTKEEAEDSDETLVYITESGSVYHRNRNCSHIKLSVTSVIGIPSGRRNDSGAKYYPCEYCCQSKENPTAVYYITSDGTRYHTRNDCPKIKRTVKEVLLSEVKDRAPCKRCGQ